MILLYLEPALRKKPYAEMKKINIQHILILFLINFVIISIISFLFAWGMDTGKTGLHIGPVLGKSLVLSIVFTVILTFFDLRKKQEE